MTVSPINRRKHSGGRRSPIPAFIAGSVLLATLALPAGVTLAGEVGFVRGEVVAWDTDAPVAGATVSLPGYGVSVVTATDGSFDLARALPTESPHRRIEVVVTAPGFGTWTLRGVRLIPDETLQVHAELRSRPYVHEVDLPSGPGAPRSSPDAVTGFTCSGWDYTLVPPPTIWVMITDEDVSKKYDFDFYVTHVLPNEWGLSWDADAIGAGALAVRTYAAYKTMTGHARSGGPGCADINDDWTDQKFDPTFSYPTTDAAVYATFGSVLYRDGTLFLSQYWAGAVGDPCQPVEEGQFAGRMSQWGTLTCAQQGRVWPDIAQVFYQNTTWNYLYNLLLNPSLSSAAMYMWEANGQTNFARVNGSGYDGSWYLDVSPKGPGKTAAVYEVRPFSGSASAAYQAAVALQCPASNADDCVVTIKVIAYPDSGQSVARKKQVTVPNDGGWRYYTYGPTPHGITHTSVRFSVITRSTVKVDAASLKGPFGGP